MTLDDALEGHKVTRKEAIAEIERHYCDADEFYTECGVQETYCSAAILAWLGY